MTQLTPYVPWDLIAERLPLIFPEGTPNRNYLVRELAAKSIFAFIYVNAIEGADSYLGPIHIYRMTDVQSDKSDPDDRLLYARMLGKGQIEGKRWYADNTREPIRDETIREGFIEIGIVTSLNLPTTSSRPRYQLKQNFVMLFDPSLTGDALLAKIEDWQNNNLSSIALNRLKLVKHSRSVADQKTLITFPNGNVRGFTSGPSTDISKAVIERFSGLFLENPVVLWLSTSDEKIADNDLAKSIGINIQADKNLPDIILADLGTAIPLLVFIEVVATDGPVSERRKNAIYELTDEAGYSREHVAFVTAYLDRESLGFKKTMDKLAWGSFAWFVSEPDRIISLLEGATVLTKLVR